MLTVAHSTVKSDYAFDTTSPMIWIPTGYFVQSRFESFDLQLTLSDPCEEIPINRQGHTGSQLTDEDLSIYRALRKECDELLYAQFHSRMQELQNMDSNPINKESRKKRMIDPFTIVLGGFVVGIVVVSNLIISWTSRFIPGTDSYKINSLELQAERDQKLLTEFKDRLNTSETIIDEIKNDFDTLKAQIEENRRKINYVTSIIPHIAWVAALIQNKILDAGYYLERILEKYRIGQASMPDIARLFNNTHFKQVATEDTILEDVVRISNLTTLFKLHIRKKSSDTKVYEIYTFNYWDKLDSKPELVSYQGPSFMIYNSSNSCMRAIEAPKDRFVNEECNEAGYRDPKLTNWVRNPNIDFTNNNRPAVKQVLLNNYVYCYGHNITLNGTIVECPTVPFKLSSTTSFHTFGHDYTARFMKIVGNEANWFPHDGDLPSLFVPQRSTNEQKLLDTLSKLKQEQKMIEDIKASSFHLGTSHSVALWIILPVACTLMLYIIAKQFIQFSFSKRQEQVYESINLDETRTNHTF